MNLKFISLALALSVSGPAMAMAVHTSGTGLGSLESSIATFQSKARAFVFQDAAELSAAPADDRASNNPVQPEVLVDDIPEPETWALLAAGLGVTALAARRRKSIRR